MGKLHGFVVLALRSLPWPATAPNDAVGLHSSGEEGKRGRSLWKASDLGYDTPTCPNFGMVILSVRGDKWVGCGERRGSTLEAFIEQLSMNGVVSQSKLSLYALGASILF